jgi:type I restriction enzyme R subunit
MLVRELAESEGLSSTLEVVPIDEKTIAALAGSKSPPRAKILNLGRSLARAARDKGAQEPYLIPIAERAEAVIERFDERQIETEQALAEIKKLVEEFTRAEAEREELGFDLPTFTHYRLLRQAGVASARELATPISAAFERWLGHAYNASKRRELKAELYRLLLPVVSREQMVGLVEQMLKLDQR